MGVSKSTGCRIRNGKIQIWFREKGQAKRTYKTLDCGLFPATSAGIIAAQKLREKIVFEIKHNIYNPANYWEEDRVNASGRFSEWAQRWLDLPEHGWSYNTRRKYKGLLQKYWMPWFHAWDIAAIEYADLVDALIESEAGEMSPGYYNDILIVIRGVIGLYCKSHNAENPAEQLSNKTRVQDEPDPFTIEEACMIIEEAKQHGWSEWFQLGFFSGLRAPGELLGLMRHDLQGDKLTIRRQRITGGRIQNYTKTKRSRTLNLNSIAMEAVTALLKKHEGEFFFTIAGQPVLSNNSQTKAWKKILEKLKLRYRTMYNMRHTFATYCLMNGQNPSYVAAQLGHSLEEFFKTYARWINQLMDKVQVKILEDAIAKNKTIARLK